MSDKELLEFAALAAGFKLIRWLPVSEFFEVTEQDGTVNYFNPLVDDGDAMRLAVKIGIDVDHDLESVTTWVHWSEKQDPLWFSENFGLDRFAATRRAIVRAAAEIGKSL